MSNIVANPYTRNLVEDSANLERSFGLVSGFLGLDTIISHNWNIEFTKINSFSGEIKIICN